MSRHWPYKNAVVTFQNAKFKSSVMRLHNRLDDRATQTGKKLCNDDGIISTVFIAVFAWSIHTSVFFNSHMTAAVSWIKLNESAKRNAFCVGFCFLITINIVKQLLFLWPLGRIGAKIMELIHNWSKNVVNVFSIKSMPVLRTWSKLLAWAKPCDSKLQQQIRYQ